MIKIGIICPSEIAFRRFMPALLENSEFQYVGLASASEVEWFGSQSNAHDLTVIQREQEKAQTFVDTYGGKRFESYGELLASDEIDAVYLPLPPALHYIWAKKVLESGKHLLCEKPFTTKLVHTEELISLAKEKNLAIHENYMFKYHSQIDHIKKLMSDGAIGDIRLIRIAFGFPFRGANDFRYNKALGGGALLDCGGYTMKLASELLGESTKITTSQLNFRDDFEVDIYGSATAMNDTGLTAQLSFGMDNSYKCEIEVWGSAGIIYTDRILTAPVGFAPTITLKQGNEMTTEVLASDDTFGKSIARFAESVNNMDARKSIYEEILHQGKLVDEFLGG